MVESSGYVIARVIAFDKDDNIICESKWKDFWLDYTSITNFTDEYDYDKVNKYFDEHIDINKKGFVNVDEWETAMQLTGIIPDVYTAKLFFYWMCYNFEKDNNENTVTSQDLCDVVCVDDYEEYTGGYGRCISSFRRVTGCAYYYCN